MVTIDHDELEQMEICNGCPHLWVRTICTGIYGTDQSVDKSFKLVCAHVEACKRVARLTEK